MENTWQWNGSSWRRGPNLTMWATGLLTDSVTGQLLALGSQGGQSCINAPSPLGCPLFQSQNVSVLSGGRWRSHGPLFTPEVMEPVAPATDPVTGHAVFLRINDFGSGESYPVTRYTWNGQAFVAGATSTLTTSARAGHGFLVANPAGRDLIGISPQWLSPGAITVDTLTLTGTTWTDTGQRQLPLDASSHLVGAQGPDGHALLLAEQAHLDRPAGWCCHSIPTTTPSPKVLVPGRAELLQWTEHDWTQVPGNGECTTPSPSVVAITPVATGTATASPWVPKPTVPPTPLTTPAPRRTPGPTSTSSAPTCPPNAVGVIACGAAVSSGPSQAPPLSGGNSSGRASVKRCNGARPGSADGVQPA